MKSPIYRLALIATMASTLLVSTPLFASETDDRIEASAKETYVFKTYLKNDKIKLQSKDGLVTLSGTVSDPSHKSLAGETVAGLPGVTRVENNLEEQGVPDTKSDAWLITKVKTTLLFHKNVNASGTEVMAQNGIITLRGEATSMAQKDLTAEYAMDVDGVKNVKNEMTAPKNEKMTGKETLTNTMDKAGEAIDDASITALVKTALLYHRSTSGLKITVETKNSVVTLGGKAKSAAEKDLAGKYASDVQGVKDVINNITAE